MTADEQAPKLHIDSDWKAQAQAEKERLAAEEAKRTEDKPAGEAGGKLPEASFQTLVGLLASQAIMGLGAMADEKTGSVAVDLEGARFNIDLLGVLDEKTKGNLADQEANELTQILRELRDRYVYISDLVVKQMAADSGSGASRDSLQPNIHTSDLTS